MGKIIENDDVLRGASKNVPNNEIWGYSLASIPPSLDLELEAYNKEVEAIKEKVKKLLIESAKELINNIELINLLCRLGVSYHFEAEIDNQLDHIFNTILPERVEDNDYDLSTLATLFRVLRQHGYNMSSDVFKKFKGGDGEFKSNICKDVKGLLCLYEACFLAVHGEDILEEALCFATKHLKTLVENSSPHLRTLIKNALVLPYHHNMERLDTLHYISFYEADESPNATLLRFAKLDFNRMQLLYRKELAILTTWWKDTNLAESCPYGRDRVPESFIWSVGNIFEPQYSLSRMNLSKHIQLEAVLDDTYDTYGTVDELRTFTNALESFTNVADGVDALPKYMKSFYMYMLRYFQEGENDVAERYSYKASYAREMYKELAKGYFVEKIWQNDGEAPSFDEYMKNGKVTSTVDFMSSVFIQGMENAGIKEMVWLRNEPPIIVGMKFFSRLMNDVGEKTVCTQDETKREDFPKAMDCYMKQYGVSRAEAYEGIERILEDKWKVMNEELMKAKSLNVPKIFLKYAFNFARMATLFYRGPDMFTYQSSSIELLTSMVLKPLPL